MGSQDELKMVEQAFGEIVKYFSPETACVDEATRLRRYDETTGVISAHPRPAAEYLATQFDDGDFVRKSAAYRLLISLGKDVVSTLKTPPTGCSEVGRIWIATVCRYFGMDSSCAAFQALLLSKNQYVRHLTALAVVFQGMAADVDRDILMETLIDALSSNDRIENGPYCVADSALSCIGLVTGIRFSDSQQQNVQFYNFNHFLFPPPVHPFPYTSERVVVMTENSRRELADRIREWWQENGRSLVLSGCRNFLQS